MEEENGVATEEVAGDTQSPDVSGSGENLNQGSDEVGGSDNESPDKDLPFGEHPRWIKQVENNRQLSSELSELKAQLEGSKEAAKHIEWLNKDPVGFFNQLKKELAESGHNLDGSVEEEGEEDQEDLYSDLPEPVAKEIKDMKSFIDRMKENEEKSLQEKEAQKLESIQKNRESLDSTFDEMAEKAGYSNMGEDVSTLIGNATLTTMLGIAKDPSMPTKEELSQAFEKVNIAVKALTKASMAEKTTHIPSGLSGNNNPITNVKTPMTDEERIMNMASSL